MCDNWKQLDLSYSYVDQDNGYLTMYQNKFIEQQIPYVDDVEPRIIQFLRTLYYYKKNAITPCIPLYMEYQIKRDDWIRIVYYIEKYNITAFNR